MDNRLAVRGSINLDKITHSVRAAQIVLQYGVGAMVDFPDQTLMTAAPEYWKDPERQDDAVIHIHDERLEKLLNVDYFGMPKDKDEYYPGIAFVRFPQWYFCPKCRRFQSLDNWAAEYKKISRNKEKDPYMKTPKCTECNVELVPARIVTVCEKGHIDDFPWIKWTHEKSLGGKRDICAKPSLTFSTGATASAGLEGLILRCNCGAVTTLAGAFNKDSLKDIGIQGCSGFMPWKNKKERCTDVIPQVVQRGASKVYFPKVISSLVIPPYSDRISTLIENSQKYNAHLMIIADFDGEDKIDFINSKIEKWTNEVSIEINIEPKLIKNILMRKLLPSLENNNLDLTTSVKYRIEEYEALTGKIPSHGINEYQFMRQEMNIKDYNIPGLDQVVLIHKIREVRALTGFSRLNPPDSFSLDTNGEIYGLMPTKEKSTRWYPGYEVKGEGIFISLSEELIDNWIKENMDTIGSRINKLNYNYSKSYLSKYTPRLISAKFVLLHTLSHMLINQLSFECGYTSASLRERIYCDTGEEEIKMSGIFVYTASGDSEGTLGGLVRQGHADCLPIILKKAIKQALMCSNDPVCIESMGQGREALNLAACHSCLLLPETSCEEFNVFLDRALVVGTLRNPSLGFCTNWIDVE